MLETALDIESDTFFFEALAEDVLDFEGVLIAFELLLDFVFVFELFIFLRIEMLEADVFHLPFQAPDTEQAGDRGVDFHGFGSDPEAFFFGQGI